MGGAVQWRDLISHGCPLSPGGVVRGMRPQFFKGLSMCEILQTWGECVVCGQKLDSNHHCDPELLRRADREEDREERREERRERRRERRQTRKPTYYERLRDGFRMMRD